ncbi:hypothetical protein LTR28_007041, partial [Elasticomyces elasticus]
MSEEPRRSGRATKGQHTKIDEPAQTQSPAVAKKGKAGKSKSSKKFVSHHPTFSTPLVASKALDTVKRVDPNQRRHLEKVMRGFEPVLTSLRSTDARSSPSEDEPEEVIRCVCGDTSDEDGRVFIACDACAVWQHNECMGLPLEEAKVPEQYYCEQCVPEDHKELLAGIERGERPWEDRIKAREEAERQARNRRKSGKRGKKGGRQSRVSDVKGDGSEEATSSPAPAASSQSVEKEGGNKRKFEEAEEGGQPIHEPSEPNHEASAPPAELARPVPANGRADKRRKSSIPAQGSESVAPRYLDAQTAVVEIKDLPAERQKVAQKLSDVMSEGIRARSSQGKFRIPDGHTPKSLSGRLASLLEYAMFMNHCGASSSITPAYGQQFRALSFNLTKNPTLLQHLLNETITPDKMSTMTTDEMASEELQKQNAQLKQQAEKQAVMVNEEDKPRVRRTHKGDEYVDNTDHQSTGESVFTNQPVRHRESMADVEMTDGSPPQPEHAVTRSPEHTGADGAMPVDSLTPAHERTRRASSSFNINNVWSQVQPQSPTTEHTQPRLLQQPPRRRSSAANKDGNTDVKQANDDADIDRLLNDEDDYSPADLGPDSSVVWRGQLLQPPNLSVTVSARFVAGGDISQTMPWRQFLPKTLEISGRIDPSKADAYLCGLQWSKTSDVSVLAMTPYDNKEDFDKVFEYFSSRGRYAVVSGGLHPMVKDLYITPMEAGASAPGHIELLEHCTLERPTPDRVLLATFVVKGGPLAEQAAPEPGAAFAGANGVRPGVRASLSGPAASPLNAQNPTFPPRSSSVGQPPSGLPAIPSANGASTTAPSPFHASTPYTTTTPAPAAYFRN